MFKIHTKDGLTTTLGPENMDKMMVWQERLKSLEFQKTITGISVVKECGAKYRCEKCNKTIVTKCDKCGHIGELPKKCTNGIQFSLSQPNGFHTFFYLIEDVKPNHPIKLKGGYRITCFVDDLKIVMMVHSGQAAVRVTLTKVGKQRYNPYAAG